MAEITAALRDEFSPTAHIDHDTNTGISNTKLGIWLFLASECLLFGGLITTYLLYKVPVAGEGPAPKQVYDLGFTSVSSFLLLMSSLTMVLAVAAIERGDHHRLRTWLAATALLGVHLRGRPGLRVHRLRARGHGLHHQPFVVGLLHADRLPRCPRHHRHHHAGLTAHHVAARPSSPSTEPRRSSASASTGTSSTWCGS